NNDPVLRACNAARQSDMEIRDILERQFQVLLRETIGVFEAEVKAGTAHPISEDLPTLVRTLAATTALMLTGDALLVGPDSDAARRVRVLEQMWLNALWGGGKAP
ncbi:TetR/AcrR family transcriptional regulator, partial [Mycobacterium tuberculosis]